MCPTGFHLERQFGVIVRCCDIGHDKPLTIYLDDICQFEFGPSGVIVYDNDIITSFTLQGKCLVITFGIVDFVLAGIVI